MEERLSAPMTSVSVGVTALRAEVTALEERLDGRMTALGGEMTSLRAEMTSLEERMIEAIRDSETKLLTEFHKWASPVELRARSHAAAIKALDAENIQDRLQKLEDRPTGT